MLISALGWRGDITVTVAGPDGLHVARIRNRITNAGLDLLAAALSGVAADITYVAVGSNGADTLDSATQLGNEEYRKAVTVQSAPGTGVLDTTLVFGPDEANGFTIREIGWFAGAAATGTPDTGVLVARVLYERIKTNLESLQINRRDTFGRA